MSQPTVNSRPADWSGTSLPILYKFTSTNYSNAGYRMEVEVWNVTTAAKIADAVYSAEPSGQVVVDVSEFLKSAITLDNNSDLTTADVVYEDTNYINYYIKYQEVWAAASETQVNDSANDRFAIYGGLQLGSLNDFTSYVEPDPAKKFLSLMDRWTAAKNYPFTFCWINGAHGGIPPIVNLSVVRKQNGTTLDTTNTLVDPDILYRGKHIETGDADTLEITVINDTPGSDSVTMTVDVLEECDNTIVLQWRNSLGGDECYPFQINQEYTWTYAGKKAKRLTLYAENLTLNQWEAIQGLNTLGDIYRINIPEALTTLNRTSNKIGQSVYVLNSDGSKTGVVVLNENNTTQTKQVKHSAFVTIEYPELFLQ